MSHKGIDKDFKKLPTQEFYDGTVVELIEEQAKNYPSRLALKYKGISLTYKQFILILFVSLPAWPLQKTSFLPFTAGAHSINRIVVHGESFPVWWYFFILGISLFYFFLGLGIFKIFETKARRFNLLGQY